MALPVDDNTPAPAFVWGSNGAQMTPEQIAARRKVADALAEKASDYSPVRSWTQGAVRIVDGLNAGLANRRADDAEQANADANTKMIAALLGQGGASSAPASVATAGTVPAAVAAAPVAASPDTTGKIYSNDEPSPLDPPSGQDRANMIATILGEAGNEPQLGKQAVASVIRTRAVDGGYGGDTPTGVVTAPNQFEPWNTQAGRDRMARAAADPKQAAAADAAIAAAYGEGGKAPEDPTEGMTHFYSPTGQAALGRSAPAWAGGESVTIGGHVFNSPDDAAPGAKPVQVASTDPAAIPANATPTQGYAVPGQPAPAVTKVAGALGNVNPAVIQALTSPYASEGTKKIAGLLMTQQLANANKEVHTQETDAKGNIWDVNRQTGQRTIALKAEPEDKPPASVAEYKYYAANIPAGQTPMDYGTWASKKARDAATNVTTNVDMNSSQSYDKQLAEGLGKSHASLANGVEDAQSRARDIAAMQGAVDAIQKAGGTTGGMAPEQRLTLQKTINAGAAALGIDKPFSESDLSDKEFLTKFNRSMAGAQAKNAVGSRVTNFEMSNFLKANPGLDMTVTGNQRLLGIQSQIEQRNIAVGNAIREATAQAISSGKKIDPVTVQKIITDYDAAHHVQDPVSGQDLTQSYALPEFQTQGTNAALAVGHEANIGKMRRFNPVTGAIE
jgi:spore germination cell wall hydrolase CwlJ-like protein